LADILIPSFTVTRVSCADTARALLSCALALAAACGGDSSADSDAGPDDGPDAALDLTPVIAVPAARCAAAERVGLVEITSGKVVRAHMFDKADPWIAAPVESDSSCAFHSFTVQQCEGCADDEICGVDDRCTAIPQRALDGRLVVRAGGDEQVFQADQTTGELGGDITLPGNRFAVEVVAFGQKVTLETETSVPDPLSDFSASLLGTYDAPEGIDAAWDPAPEGSHLFTRIPVNHHAAGPTFTECAADASLGTLHIDQPMLEPLAVATGLEFQSFEHIRFAAGETSRGCVEFRFTQSQSFGLEGI
jgi:hypothetical protein